MKKCIFCFIFGILLTVVVGVSASIIYKASDITFNPSDTSWSVGNVEDAINDIKNNYVPKSTYVNKVYTFDFTGSYEEFTAEYSGDYKIELWGAQGNYPASLRSIGGKGAYTKGVIHLNVNDKLYVYVGENRTDHNTSYNCGSTGGSVDEGNTTGINGYGGGGATDVRLVSGEWNDTTSLVSRIMVAAGGGGGTDYTTAANGGDGGTLIGFSGISGYNQTKSAHTILPTGGTQVSGGIHSTQIYATTHEGKDGSFGIGGDASQTYGSGGGGGYYGGAGGGATAGVVDSGAGGSSYISGYTGCVAIQSATSITVKSGCTSGTTDIECSKHYSGYYFILTDMNSGEESMPTHDGTSTMTGNAGNGYAKITLISID